MPLQQQLLRLGGGKLAYLLVRAGPRVNFLDALLRVDEISARVRQRIGVSTYSEQNRLARGGYSVSYLWLNVVGLRARVGAWTPGLVTRHQIRRVLYKAVVVAVRLHRA